MEKILTLLFTLNSLSTPAEKYVYVCRFDQHEKYIIVLDQGAKYVVRNLLGRVDVLQGKIEVKRFDQGMALTFDPIQPTVNWEAAKYCYIRGHSKLKFLFTFDGNKVSADYQETPQFLVNPAEPNCATPDYVNPFHKLTCDDLN
jgi:hypothetical protein